MGTMFGILIGVGYLVGTGALAQLIGEAGPQQGTSGVHGIQALLGGVALAMITSIIGIIFTTIGSYIAKNAKREAETTKNIFLSWMQATLLPELSSDTTNALNKLTRNLNAFNNTFSLNTRELRETLAIVKDTTLGQVELLENIRDLNVKSIANANIKVYRELQNATDEIGKFGEYVHGINEYVENVKELSKQLGEANQRISMIEEMAQFFKEERANLDVIRVQIGKADQAIGDTIGNLQTSTTNHIDKLINHNATEQARFQEVINAQQENMQQAIANQKTIVKEALQHDIETLHTVTKEIQQITSVKESMSRLEAATQQQNKKIDQLTDAIMKLATAKTDNVSGARKWLINLRRKYPGKS